MRRGSEHYGSVCSYLYEWPAAGQDQEYHTSRSAQETPNRLDLPIRSRSGYVLLVPCYSRPGMGLFTIYHEPNAHWNGWW